MALRADFRPPGLLPPGLFTSVRISAACAAVEGVAVDMSAPRRVSRVAVWWCLRPGRRHPPTRPGGSPALEPQLLGLGLDVLVVEGRAFLGRGDPGADL